MSELNHTIEIIDLSVAGSKTIDQFSGMLRWIDTVDAGGAQDLTGKVKVKLGQVKREGIPFRLNSKLSGETARELTITWAAQSGLIATFLLTPDPKVLDVEAPPSAQLLVGSLASSSNSRAGTVGVAAAELVAANSSRKMVTIYNNGTATIYIGDDNTVAVATDFPVAAGQSYNTEQFNGAIWAISGTAGQDVRIREEG